MGLPLTDVLPATEDLPDWKEASYVASRYGAMVSEGGPMLTSAIHALATGDALPAVLHCSAGKDRTGVLSALLLAFLGVPDETIVADYALSAAAMERLLERLKAEYPEAQEEVERYAPAILHVVPETMEQFLAESAGQLRHLRRAGRLPRGHRGRRHPALHGAGRRLTGRPGPFPPHPPDTALSTAPRPGDRTRGPPSAPVVPSRGR